MRVSVPQISTPEFWPARLDQIYAAVEAVKGGQVEEIGASAGGRPIHAVIYPGKNGAIGLAIEGGEHGHEPQGPVTCLNLLSILETGKDLWGKAWPAVDPALGYLVVPLVNPDARVRMPNAFVGLSVEDVRNYSRGLFLDGHRQGDDDIVFPFDVDPKEMLIVGGIHNDWGQDITSCKKPEHTKRPEASALVSVMERYPPQVAIQFHAHCNPPQFWVPFTDLAPEIQQRQLEMVQAVMARGVQAGWEFLDPIPTQGKNICGLWNKVAGAVPFLLESTQGTVDAGPLWDHGKILDANLFIVSEFCRLLTESESPQAMSEGEKNE